MGPGGINPLNNMPPRNTGNCIDLIYKSTSIDVARFWPATRLHNNNQGAQSQVTLCNYV
jgi:hypothetical protein